MAAALLSWAGAGSAWAQEEVDWEKHWRECPRHIELESGKSTVVEAGGVVARIAINGSDVAAFESAGAKQVRVTGYEPGYDFLRGWLDGDRRFEVCIKVTARHGPPPHEAPAPAQSPGPCQREGRTVSVASMVRKPGDRTKYFVPGWKSFSVPENADVVRVEGAGANYVLVTAVALGSATAWICSEKDFRMLVVSVTPEGSPVEQLQERLEAPPRRDSGM
jgi:hypothetical protein